MLDSSDYLYFEAAGDGTLVRDLGTSTGSAKVQAYNGRARICLMKNGGSSVVVVRSQGLGTAFVTIEK